MSIQTTISIPRTRDAYRYRSDSSLYFTLGVVTVANNAATTLSTQQHPVVRDELLNFSFERCRQQPASSISKNLRQWIIDQRVVSCQLAYVLVLHGGVLALRAVW